MGRLDADAITRQSPDDDYPSPESQTGWRWLRSADEIRALGGMDPEQLQRACEYNARFDTSPSPSPHDDLWHTRRETRHRRAIPTETGVGPFEAALGFAPTKARRWPSGRWTSKLAAEPGTQWDYSDPAMAHLSLAFFHVTGMEAVS